MGEKKIILYKDFTPEQKALAEELKGQMFEACEEINEFSDVQIYALVLDEQNGNRILFDFGFGNPEGNGDTIFHCY